MYYVDFGIYSTQSDLPTAGSDQCSSCMVITEPGSWLLVCYGCLGLFFCCGSKNALQKSKPKQTTSLKRQFITTACHLPHKIHLEAAYYENKQEVGKWETEKRGAYF